MGVPRKPEQCRVNHQNFVDIVTPFYSYVLGLIWTDGHINKNNNTISFISTFPDGDYFWSCFLKTGEWNIYTSDDKKHPTWKTRVTINTTNKYLKDFLKLFHFMDKNKGFSDIYNYTPYKEHFLRGIIDGDGSIRFDERRGQYYLSICSNINQSWEPLPEIFDSKNLKYKIQRTKTKNGSYSKIFVHGKSRVEKLCDWLYSTYNEDKIGLLRKWKNYQLIKSKCNKWVMSDAQ